MKFCQIVTVTCNSFNVLLSRAGIRPGTGSLLLLSRCSCRRENRTCQPQADRGHEYIYKTFQYLLLCCLYLHQERKEEKSYDVIAMIGNGYQFYQLWNSDIFAILPLSPDT